MSTLALNWTTAYGLLRTLYAPQAVIHVGAGQGIGEIHAWRTWDVPFGLSIEADPQRSRGLKTPASERNHSPPVVHTVVASSNDTHPFYSASHPAEDGLLDPMELTRIWPQIQRLEARQITTTTIDSVVLTHAGPEALMGAWLIVDCLPAHELLAGAKIMLRTANVVIARTLDPEGVKQIAEALAPAGFTVLASVETNHPAIKHVLMVKEPSQLQHALINSKERLRQLESESTSQKSMLDARTAELHAVKAEQRSLSLALEAEKKLTAEGYATRELSLKQIEQTNHKLQASEARARQFSAERDVQAKLALQRQAAIDALMQDKAALAAARDAEVAAKHAMLAQRDAESKAKT
jgi:hypothetical protein